MYHFVAYLPHPLVLYLRNPGVGVAHHGDEQIEQEDVGDEEEQEEIELGKSRSACSVQHSFRLYSLTWPI